MNPSTKLHKPSLFAYSALFAASLASVGFATNALAHSTGSAHAHGSVCHAHEHSHVSPNTGERVTHTHKHCHSSAADMNGPNSHKHHPIRGGKAKKATAAPKASNRYLEPEYPAPIPQVIAPVYQAPTPMPAPAPVYQAPAPAPAPVPQPLPSRIQSIVNPPAVVVDTGWEKHNRSVNASLSLTSTDSVFSNSTSMLNRQVISTETKQAIGGGLSLRYQSQIGNSGQGIFFSADAAKNQAAHKIVEDKTGVELYNDKKGCSSTRGDVKLGWVAHSDSYKQIIPYVQGVMKQQKASYAGETQNSNSALLGILVQTKLSDKFHLEGNLGFGRVLKSQISQAASSTVAANESDLGKGNAINGGVRLSYDISDNVDSFLSVNHHQERLNSDLATQLNSNNKKETDVRLGLGLKY